MQNAVTQLPKRIDDKGPTHGYLFDSNGKLQRTESIRSSADPSLISDLDLDADERRSWSLLSHVEAHVAAAMRRGKAPDHAVLVINNRTCPGQLSCSRYLESILKPGQRLTVWEQYADGTLRPEPRVFNGTGERIKP